MLLHTGIQEDPITTPQLNFIDGKCKQLNVDVIAFINQGEKTYKNISEVTKMTASKMLKLLNEYQNKDKETPESVKGYKNNWRDA